MDWKKKLIEGVAAAGSKVVLNANKDGRMLHRTSQVVRVTASNFPVKELAVMCGRTGAAGAIVDGALGGVQALRALKQGKIDGRQALLHTGTEAGCGFVTSTSGTAGTLAIYMITGAMGPLAIAAGMGASLGSRHIYRKVVGETILDQPQSRDSNSSDDDPIEHIGPTQD